MSIESVNPLNGEVVRTYQPYPAELVTRKIRQSHQAFLSWKNTSFSDRAFCMTRMSDILRKRKHELAKLMAVEMGKPIKAGEGEIEKCALVCEYYAKNAEEFLARETVPSSAARSYITFNPLGVVLAIMPWNFPFWQTFRFLAPGLMAGNCCLLKHASNVPGCAIATEEIIKEAGFPDHVFQTLLVESSAVEKIIENPVIKAVTLTGSTEAGMKVAQKAASLIKKVVLELGGSDPYLVLKDADVPLAAATCAESRLINSGQSCIAAKRFIVVKEVAEEFIRLFKEEMQSKNMGNPLDEATTLGPMAKKELRDQLHEQVTRSIDQGAECILGGEISPGSHAFYPPTILINVKKGMPAYEEEMFGPVASVITVSDEEEAIQVANDTSFGLGSAVFTTDIERGEEIAASRLNSGCSFVNDYVKSTPELPFGGVNQSGFGRELGTYGIKEFVNIKTVYIK
ncbi:NAD-dependent succinate-semialdehyde dehydrogenase [Arcticibacter tournemirensis]|uniref:NAD-dependent succinate-semialdehyde dehydrogenase n=1 Tax=Arcticibacter tournemirensis TaxID=699437 RepID=A0A4Q0M2H8_9SPHI|nr:NAD-dependent succinate-semialdehyde dehydrogenase [Arcticibacter tournemirensis]RXF67080.1 NAD-dependent succinate-semialdehyde dehydrogenase [Arcticibacter tournemirensis]